MRILRKTAALTAGALLALLVLLALSAALVAVVVLVLGGDPAAALRAIHAGAVGSPTSVTESLIKATPLIMTGLSAAVAFRCGIWNIGAEGQLLVGMLGAAVTALTLPPLPPPVGALLCLLAGAASGAAWAAVPAALKVKREVPEVISTIMLNFIAVYLIVYLVRGPLRDPTSANDWSPLLPEWTYLRRLDRLLPASSGPLPFGRLHLGVLTAILTAAVVWGWLAHSGTGFRIRAVGANPDAARTAGIPAARTLVIAFLLSGGLAGLGGAIEMLGLIQRMFPYEPGSPGYGFSGIAVALLGRLHPAGVLAAALFFGGLTAGCNQMQRTVGITFHVAYVIQAALVLLLVLLPRSAPGSSRTRRSEE
jgi:general nucleoside transport system permease protein